MDDIITQLEHQLQSINNAISALRVVQGSDDPPAKNRGISAASRKRMSEAAKAYWAAKRAGKAEPEPKRKDRSRFSAATRKRMAAAQKKRWAAVRAASKTAKKVVAKKVATKKSARNVATKKTTATKSVKRFAVKNSPVKKVVKKATRTPKPVSAPVQAEAMAATATE
jgi:hypothetical protein